MLSRLLDGERPDPGELKAQVGRIRTGLERLEFLLDDARAYSQTTPAERRPERLADLVKEANGLVRDSFAAMGLDHSGVSVDVSVPESIILEVSRHHIVMALRNIIKNAYEAFATAPTRLGGGRIEIRARVPDEETVEIMVGDDGMGMSKDDLADVLRFIPGGTSKKAHGTGFGLPNAWRRIIDHGGSLAIESEEDRGTTVTVSLPLDAPESEAR